MNKDQFIKKYNLTEDQFFGRVKIEGNLNLRSLTSIPEGFNPTVGGGLNLRSLTSIPEGFNPTVGGWLDLESLTSIPEGFNPTVGGWLDLESLTSIPEGFNPTVGGGLNLESLTSIPEGFNPTVGGWLDLRSLTSIPEGFNPTVGGWLDLESLTSIPEGFNPTVGGWLDLESLTSIPEGFNPTVGGGLDLRSLTSIPEGFNPTVGGWLDLRSLTSIPEGFNPTVGGWLDLESDLRGQVETNEPGLLQWEDGQYVLFDDMLAEVVSKKGGYWLCRKVGSQQTYYVATNGEQYAHGKTLRQAKADLSYKINGRNPSVFKGLPLNHSFTVEEAIVCYRAVTGACSFGVEDFMSRLAEVKDAYTVEEIIKVTSGAYGNNSFKDFFSAVAA